MKKTEGYNQIHRDVKQIFLGTVERFAQHVKIIRKSASGTVTVRTQRCFNIYATSITLEQRRMNVKMTLCA